MAWATRVLTWKCLLVDAARQPAILCRPYAKTKMLTWLMHLCFVVVATKMISVIAICNKGSSSSKSASLPKIIHTTDCALHNTESGITRRGLDKNEAVSINGVYAPANVCNNGDIKPWRKWLSIKRRRKDAGDAKTTDCRFLRKTIFNLEYDPCSRTSK